MLIRTKSGSHICELYDFSTTFNSVLVQSFLLLEENICILTGFSLHSACPFGVKYGRKVAFQSSDR
jgi:hypothetical protein